MSDPTIVCAGCGKQYKWTPKVAGMSAKCRCGTMVEMPKSAPQAAAPSGPPSTPPVPAPATDTGDEVGGEIPLSDNPLFSLDTPLSITDEQADTPAASHGAAPLDLSDDSDAYGLGDHPDRPASAPAAGGVATGTCPSCNNPLAPDAVLCINCGYNLTTGKVMGGAAAAVADDGDDYDDGMTPEERKKWMMEEYYLPAGLTGAGFILGLIAVWMQFGGGDELGGAGVGVGIYIVVWTLSTLFSVAAMVGTCFIIAKLISVSFGNLFGAIIKLAAIATLPAAVKEIIIAFGGSWTIGNAVAFGGYFGMMSAFFGLETWQIIVFAIVSFFVKIGVAIVLVMSLLSLLVGAATVGGLGDLEEVAPAEVQGVSVIVDAPPTVKRGETFEIVLHITNETDQPRSLVGVDIYVDYLQIVTITGSDPMHGTPVDEGFYTTYPIDLPLPPKQTTAVTLHARGQQGGVVTSQIDVMIDSEDTFAEKSITTMVTK